MTPKAIAELVQLTVLKADLLAVEIGEDISTVIRIVDGDIYAFCYTEKCKRLLKKAFYRLAKHPELSFTSQDAKEMNGKVNVDNRENQVNDKFCIEDRFKLPPPKKAPWD